MVRRGFVTRARQHDSDEIETSPFNQANLGGFGAKSIKRGLLQPEHMGYVQTPIRIDPEEGPVGGLVFAVRIECEHWSPPGLGSKDCRFRCEERKYA